MNELYGLTQNFCDSDSASVRVRRAAALFASIWGSSSERGFEVRLLRWIRMLEQDHELGRCFAVAWNETLAGLDSVTLFAEAGLPGHHALPAELMGRVFQRLLPSAREESDTGRLFAEVFPSQVAVERFVGQQRFVFERLMKILWPGDGGGGGEDRRRCAAGDLPSGDPGGGARGYGRSAAEGKYETCGGLAVLSADLCNRRARERGGEGDTGSGRG